MNKITKFYVSVILSIMTTPTAIFANYHLINETRSNNYQSQIYNHDPYNHEKQNQSYESDSEIIGDRSWETTSNRMNRQAAATSNVRSNPNQNRDEQTGDGSWETTSSRMNRQAAATSNTRSRSNWVRDEENRNDSDAAIRRNVQR